MTPAAAAAATAGRARAAAAAAEEEAGESGNPAPPQFEAVAAVEAVETEEELENAQATVALLRVAGQMLKTNLGGVQKLLGVESSVGVGAGAGATGMEEDDGDGGAMALDAEVERLSAALQGLLFSSMSVASSSQGEPPQPPMPAAATAAAAAAAAQAQAGVAHMTLATPPRALQQQQLPNPAAPFPTPAAAAAAMAAVAARRSSTAASRLSSASTASSLGLGAHQRKLPGWMAASRRGTGSGGGDMASSRCSAAAGGGSEGGGSPATGTGTGTGTGTASHYARGRSSLLLMLCAEGVGDPVEAVLGDGALLHEIMTFLVPPTLAARPLLGQLALVAPLWREAAATDVFWQPVSCALFPALPAAVPGAGPLEVEDTGLGAPDPQGAGKKQELTINETLPDAGAGGAAGGDASSTDDEREQEQEQQRPLWQRRRTRCKEQVLAVGKALATPQFRSTSAWQEGLSLIYEVVDQRDGLRLFYGTGPIHVAVGNNVILRITGTGRKETAASFSAADRDPGAERFASIKEMWKQAHTAIYPAAFRIRVLVCDDRTGKVALLYQSDENTKRHAKTPNASYWQDFLPENSLYVWDSDSVVYGKEGQQKLAAAFYCVPVEDEDDEDEDDDDEPNKYTRYRIAGGDPGHYPVHSSYVSLDFSTQDGEGVGKFVTGLLQSAP